MFLDGNKVIPKFYWKELWYNRKKSAIIEEIDNVVTIMKIIVSLVNYVHDSLNQILRHWMPGLTDKDLHFIVIGIIGLTIFILTDYLFKKLAKYNISIISFIYTFTVLMVIVFSIEIEQKITGRGSMEFSDIVFGLWGSIVLVVAYILVRIIFKLVCTQLGKIKHNG